MKSVLPGFLVFVGVWIDTPGPAGVMGAPVAVVLSLVNLPACFGLASLHWGHTMLRQFVHW